jgi:murein DD-endopeptidase MepM/ murein hydrolase activator NlpD
MSDNKRTGRGMFGKGYYIALVLCAAAIGTTGYLYNRNANETPSQLNMEVPEATLSGGKQQVDVAVIATQPQGISPTESVDQPADSGKKSLKTVSPVAGQTVAVYSMEALSYNETTRDWRVHNGIDIAAEAGAEVCAAADGEVYTVYEDETLGHTVVIRHTGGYTTRYSSLDQEIPVHAGDQVTAGQVIGTVGATALVETAMGPHVHFSVSYQDQPMDPAEFLAMGQ